MDEMCVVMLWCKCCTSVVWCKVSVVGDGVDVCFDHYHGFYQQSYQCNDADPTPSKFWECNQAFFKVRGDPEVVASLKSFWRRFLAFQLVGSFTSNPAEVCIEKNFFPEDGELSAFLQGPYARLAYMKHMLMPFIHSASILVITIQTFPQSFLHPLGPSVHPSTS